MSSTFKKNNFKIYVSCVKTVGVYVCKFGICGTKFQRKPLKKKPKQKLGNDKSLCCLCVLYMRTENLGKFCIYYFWILRIF